MRKTLALLLCLLPELARAQPRNMLLLGVGSSAAAGPSFTGPGDVVSGANWWVSMSRGYSAAYATGSNVAGEIRRASDNRTCKLLVTTSGTIGNTTACSNSGDNGSTVTTFCNPTSCFVDREVDQTGNGHDVTQATAANQPQFIISCQNSQPCIDGVSGAGILQGTSATAAQPVTNSAVILAATTALQYFCANDGGSMAIYAGNIGAGDRFYLYSGTNLQGPLVVANTWFAIQGVGNGASSVMLANGTSIPGNAGTAGADTSINAPYTLDGRMGECGQWPIGFTGTQQANMETNQRTFYGF